MPLRDILIANRDLAFDDGRMKEILINYVLTLKNYNYRYQDDGMKIHIYTSEYHYNGSWCSFVRGSITNYKTILYINKRVIPATSNDLYMMAGEYMGSAISISKEDSDYYGLTFGDLLPKRTKRAI